MTDCNNVEADGCEVNLLTDRYNCGKCGEICLFANATPQCNQGTCEIAECTIGFADCNGDPADGCEVNVGTDPEHCSACDNVCIAPANREALCLGGSCVAGDCKEGFGDCNLDDADGCEIDLLTDAVHCGKCDNLCPAPANAQPACIKGACGVGTCDMGYDDCDNSIWSGCESDLANDSSHCGACQAACMPVAGGAPSCVMSQCVVGSCDAGLADCDNKVSTGCETDLKTSVQNCGACGNNCGAVANGTPACIGFACGIGSCNNGYDDCYGGAADGCETHLLTDLSHCGACSAPCANVANGTKSCSNGSCAIGSCDTGYADCDNNVGSGCEIDTNNNISHCGSCSNPCTPPSNASAACTNGTCGLGTCNSGYDDCNNNPGDGCEKAILSDPNNCGGCGIKCGSGSCSGGVCACNKNVLVIADDSASGSQVLTNALSAAGFTATQTAVPSYQYNGTNPALSSYGSVVLLAGGPASTSYTTDMPAGGQNALLSFVTSSGHGLVMTEWAAYQRSFNRWATLDPLVLLTRTAAYSGQTTYTVDGSFASHPLWVGLPASFAFASTSNVGTAKIAPFVTRVAGSTQAIDAVALRDAPIGRVVHIAHAGNYAPNGWTNANIQKLVANSVGWVARCP